MISHLTPERREINFDTHINQHHGQFKYWPQVYKLWMERRYGPKMVSKFDFTEECYQHRASWDEIARHCGRRR